MNTITIPVTKTVTEEKTVTLPYFTKSDTRAYKALKNDLAVEVYTNQGRPRIQIVGLSVMFHENKDELECTEAEFMELYNNTQDKINQLVKS